MDLTSNGRGKQVSVQNAREQSMPWEHRAGRVERGRRVLIKGSWRKPQREGVGTVRDPAVQISRGHRAEGAGGVRPVCGWGPLSWGSREGGG